MARRDREVKVVLIDTQHVVTDPVNFKSVVQGLTRKDSSVSWIDDRGFTGSTASTCRNIIPAVVFFRGIRAVVGHNNGNYCGGPSSRVNDRGGLDNLRLTKSLSFKDLDQMIIELPMDEWNDLWGPMHV